MSETTSPAPVSIDARHLATLVAWARFSRGATTWRGVEAALDAPAPPDVVAALESMRETALPEIVTAAPIDLLTKWRSTLDERESDILTHRLLRLGPGRATLDQLGQMHSLTRERVRQIESGLLRRLRAALEDEAYQPVRWALFQLDSGLGTFAPDSEVPLDADETTAADTFRLLLHAGGFVHDGESGAVRRSDFRLPQAKDLPLVDEGPLVDQPALHERLTAAGVATQHLDFTVDHIDGIRRLDGALVLWPRNIASKGVAVLAVRQRPMTPDEIADVIAEDFNRRGFRDRIFNDPRTMRSSRHHVALRAWDLPEYGGVVPAMVERLADGPMPLADLAQELASAFTISPASVSMYSAAPIFRTQGGTIQLRPKDDPFVPTTNPAKVTGLYRHDVDRLAWHVRTDRDILRGSGRAIPTEVAVFLGSAPPSTIHLQHLSKAVPLTWSETSNTGPTIGSLRELAASVGAEEGQLLRLVFDRTDRSISVHVVDEEPHGSPAELLARLTGLDANRLSTQATVAEAIGATDEDVIATLTSRGDTRVADLVARLPEGAG